MTRSTEQQDIVQCVHCGERRDYNVDTICPNCNGSMCNVVSD